MECLRCNTGGSFVEGTEKRGQKNTGAGSNLQPGSGPFCYYQLYRNRTPQVRGGANWYSFA